MANKVRIATILLVTSLMFGACKPNYTILGIQELKQQLKSEVDRINQEKQALEVVISSLKQELLGLIKGIEANSGGLSLSKEDDAKLKFLLKQVVSYK